MRTSRFLLPLLLLIALAACGDAPSGPHVEVPNDFPPSVTLEASRHTGEAAFDVSFQASASDPDGNHLAYAWRVNGEPVTGATGPALTFTFYEAGSYEVTILVSDGLHEASASVTVTVTNDYRPSEAPDVAIIGFGGRCGIFPKCSAPAQNRAYLSEDPRTLQAIERTFHQLGHTTMAFSFRSHLHDSATYGPGYRSADALLEFVRDEWIRDFRNPTRVVLVAHSHGNQFMSLLAWDHPEIDFAYGLYLDAVCALWDGDHIRTGQFSDAYGPQENFPKPLNILGAACDSLFVPDVGQEDISDVVPWNVWWAIEVASNGIGLPSAVADDDPNHRPDGTSGNAVGLTGIFQTDEGHLDVHRDDSKALNWVLDTIALNGLPPLGLTPQAVTRDLVTPPAPQGFRLNPQLRSGTAPGAAARRTVNARQVTRMRDEPTHPQGNPTEASVPASSEHRLAPVHPGEILGSEFLELLALSPSELAEHLRLRAEHLEQLLRGERGVTADDALRLARYFGTTPEFWLNLQAQHDLEVERERIRHELAAITPRPADDN